MAAGVLTAAIAEVGLISYRDFSKGSSYGSKLPLPRELFSVAIVFGVLGMFPEAYANVAGIIGWGLVIGTGLRAFSLPGTAPLASAAPVTPAPVR